MQASQQSKQSSDEKEQEQTKKKFAPVKPTKRFFLPPDVGGRWIKPKPSLDDYDRETY